MFVRIALVCALMLVSTVAANWFPLVSDLSEWSGTVVGLIYGVILYVLQLWELNGPLGVAVEKYLSGSAHDPV